MSSRLQSHERLCVGRSTAMVVGCAGLVCHFTRSGDATLFTGLVRVPTLLQFVATVETLHPSTGIPKSRDTIFDPMGVGTLASLCFGTTTTFVLVVGGRVSQMVPRTLPPTTQSTGQARASSSSLTLEGTLMEKWNRSLLGTMVPWPLRVILRTLVGCENDDLAFKTQ